MIQSRSGRGIRTPARLADANDSDVPIVQRRVPGTAGRRRPKKKSGFPARVVGVVTQFLRRALSLAAAMDKYEDTFVSPYELEGTGVRAEWRVIEAEAGTVLELKEKGGDPGEVTAVPSVLCSGACRMATQRGHPCVCVCVTGHCAHR